MSAKSCTKNDFFHCFYNFCIKGNRNKRTYRTQFSQAFTLSNQFAVVLYCFQSLSAEFAFALFSLKFGCGILRLRFKLEKLLVAEFALALYDVFCNAQL